jgi:vancomycin aglycone glucosyltransferase
MRVLLSTYGSRGDVQPLVALGLALQAIGVEALISAPADAEFVELLERESLPLAPAFMPVRLWIAQAKQSGLRLPQVAAKMVPAQFDSIAAAAKGCDAIVATGLFPSVAAAQSVAEKLGIHFSWAAFCPLMVPSPHHPPMEYPGWPHPPELTSNLALWEFNAQAKNALFGAAVNTHRASIMCGIMSSHIAHGWHRIRPWVDGSRPTLPTQYKPVPGPCRTHARFQPSWRRSSMQAIPQFMLASAAWPCTLRKTRLARPSKRSARRAGA